MCNRGGGWPCGLLAAFALESFGWLPFCARLGAESLPCVPVADARLILCTNGAFVVERGGRYLMDGGLSLATPKWERWAQQVRNARHVERWARGRENGGELKGKDDEGNLGELRGKRDGGNLGELWGMRGLVRNDRTRETLAAFEEAVDADEGRARFRHQVRLAGTEKGATTALALEYLGGTYHFPVRLYKGQTVRFEPGFAQATCPPELKKSYIARQSARHVIVGAGTDIEFALSTDQPVDWTLVDDREFEHGTYRLFFNVPSASLGAAAKPEGAQIAYSLMPRFRTDEAIIRAPDWRAKVRDDGSFEVYRGAEEILEGGLFVSGAANEKPWSAWQPNQGFPLDRRTPAQSGEPRARLARRGWLTTPAGTLQYQQDVSALNERIAISYAVTWSEGLSPSSVGLALAVPETRSGAMEIVGQAAVFPLSLGKGEAWHLRVEAWPDAKWQGAVETVWSTKCRYATALQSIEAAQAGNGQTNLTFSIGIVKGTPTSDVP